MQLAAVAFGQLRERRLISGRRGSDNGLVLGIALCCLCPLHELLTSSAAWHRPCNQEKRPPVERAARRPGSTFGAFLEESSADRRVAAADVTAGSINACVLVLHELCHVLSSVTCR